MSITLLLAPGAEILADPRDLFIDVNALARALASNAWPLERCRDTLAQYFARTSSGMTPVELRDAYGGILDAAARERDVRSMIERVIELMDFSDIDNAPSATRAGYVLYEAASRQTDDKTGLPLRGRWLASSANEITQLLKVLKLAPAERPRYALHIVRWLEFAVEESASALRARLAELPPPRLSDLAWWSTEDVLGRLFSLVTHGLSDDERVLVPLRERAPSGVVAGFLAFCSSQGAERPRAKVPLRPDRSRHDWATYAAMLRRRLSGAAFDSAVAELFERHKSPSFHLRAICDELADGSDGETWGIGGHVIRHSGNPNAGRWSIKRAATPRPPAVAKSARGNAPRASKATREPAA